MENPKMTYLKNLLVNFVKEYNTYAVDQRNESNVVQRTKFEAIGTDSTLRSRAEYNAYLDKIQQAFAELFNPLKGGKEVFEQLSSLGNLKEVFLSDIKYDHEGKLKVTVNFSGRHHGGDYCLCSLELFA